MNKIILDPTVLTSLGNLDHYAELWDQSGRILGYFTPAADRDLYATAEIPPIDEEELRRLEKEPTYTTAEVLEHLEKLSRGEHA